MTRWGVRLSLLWVVSLVFLVGVQRTAITLTDVLEASEVSPARYALPLLITFPGHPAPVADYQTAIDAAMDDVAAWYQTQTGVEARHVNTLVVEALHPVGYYKEAGRWPWRELHLELEARG